METDNNAKPTLTIITVCYNQYDIEETCQSIVSQTWQDFQWIVIDGGSTDGTLEKIKKYEYRINILVSEKDTGIYNAMNKGIKLSNGIWLNFMNGGDSFYNENVLKNVFENNEYKKIDILYGSINVYYGNKCNIVTCAKRIKKYDLQIDTLPHQASFIRKKCFDMYGLYDEEYKIISDTVKFNQLIHKKKCKYKQIKYTIANFKLGGISSKKENSEIYKNERHKLLLSLYSFNEAINALEHIDKENTQIYRIYLISLFSLIRIKKTTYSVRIYIFYIPILQILFDTTNNEIKIYTINFIPIWKINQLNNSRKISKHYFLHFIPLLKAEENKDMPLIERIFSIYKDSKYIYIYIYIWNKNNH